MIVGVIVVVLSGAVGYVLGRKRSHAVGIGIHTIGAVVTVWLWVLSENTPGWEAVTYALYFYVALALWVPLVIGYVVGALGPRAP